MFKSVLATLMLVLSSSAVAVPLKAPGIPTREKDVAKMYPDAVKLRDGVYDVNRDGRGRIFLFGAGGEQYRLEYLQKLRQMTPKTNNPKRTRANLDRMIGSSQRLLARRLARQGSILKSDPIFIENENICYSLVDIDVAYTGGFSNAGAYAYINAEPDGFGFWEGSYHIMAYAVTNTYTN